LQDGVKIGQGAIGSHEKAPPEHRVNPANPNVDNVSFGLRIVLHDAAQPIRWTTPRLFLAPSLKCSPTYEGDPPGYVAISPDGRRALSSGGDRRVIVWRLNDPPNAWRDTMLNSYWPNARDKPSTVAFAGPEEAIVTTGDGSLFVLDLREKESEPKRLEGRHAAGVDRVLVSRAGRLFVTSSFDGTVKVWDLDTRRSIAVFDAHPGCVEQLSASAERVLLHTRDGVLKIVSLRDGALLNVFQGDKQIETCAADAELQWVVARDQGGQMHFLHVERRDLTRCCFAAVRERGRRGSPV